MIKATRYTIIVATDYARRLLRFSLSSRAVLVTILAALSIMCGLAILAVTSLKIHNNTSEFYCLVQENRSNEDQLEEFNDQFEEIAEHFERLNKDKSELMVMYGFKIENNRSSLSGIGGPAPEDEGTLVREKRDEFLDHELADELNRLQHRMKWELASLNDLLSIVEGHEDQLNSTPSIHPASGFFSSGFGFRRDPINRTIRMHNGIDINNRIGTPVYASANGIVVFTGVESGYGNMVTINHGYGITTNYAHLNDILVREGDEVKRGDKIGTIGVTGRTTGPHLHYEVRINGVPMDPKTYITD
jgi:murein DD-endopeptidase MepM/ murein hydrolase activator NlpD